VASDRHAPGRGPGLARRQAVGSKLDRYFLDADQRHALRRDRARLRQVGGQQLVPLLAVDVNQLRISEQCLPDPARQVLVEERFLGAQSTLWRGQCEVAARRPVAPTRPAGRR